MSGYARFHRSLIGHPAFRNDAEAMAFAYMVLRASWKPARVRYKGKAISLNRGQLAMSVRDLAEAMDRDKGWVERLLKRLKFETMCETRAETGVLVITICNYEKYQAANDERETPGKTPDETDARQTQDTEQGTEEGKKERTLPSGRGARARCAADTRLPENWQPEPLIAGSPTAQIVASWEPGRLERELAKFRDHYRAAPGAKGMARDWQAKLRTWITNSEGFGGSYGQRSNGLERGRQSSGFGSAVDAGYDFIADQRAH